MKTFYATLSDNHNFNGKPGGGYVEIKAENIMEAREKIHQATDGRWAFMYDALEKVHPLDRIKLGDL
jgi:hypothetical protein